MLPRAVRALLAMANSFENKPRIEMSFIEVYNDKVRRSRAHAHMHNNTHIIMKLTFTHTHTPRKARDIFFSNVFVFPMPFCASALPWLNEQ